ncbi:MAG: hypothetical protein GX458_11485 [Phyllobacteriaceae bacterium]|nr:hypothetical protein [Phyllobacteriaceae bacterium]
MQITLLSWLVGAITVGGSGVASAVVIRQLLKQKSWSLTDALSEEVELSILEADGRPVTDATGAAMKATTLKASVSRLIALFGLIGILMAYIGFALILLVAFADEAKLSEETIASAQAIVKFLLAGLTMFAPYLVSRFSAAFEALRGRLG